MDPAQATDELAHAQDLRPGSPNILTGPRDTESLIPKTKPTTEPSSLLSASPSRFWRRVGAWTKIWSSTPTRITPSSV